MALSHLVSTVQAGGGTAWGIFLAYFRPCSSSWALSNCTVTRSRPNRTLWDTMEHEIHTIDVQPQIRCNCMAQSCQYGPKPMMNVSKTLLNLCREELKRTSRQNGVQPLASRVHRNRCMRRKYPEEIVFRFCICRKVFRSQINYKLK